MKRLWATLLIATVILTGCSSKSIDTETQVEKPVKVMNISSVEDNDTIEYFGVVTSQEMVKLSFKSTNTLSKVNVNVGQNIKKGDVLAVLDKNDLNIGLKAAEANYKAADALYNKAVNGATQEEKNQAESQLKQATDTMNYAKDNYEKIKSLYEKGSVSKKDLDGAKLEYDVRKSSYDAAKEARDKVLNGAREEDKLALKEQRNQAKADYDYKKSLLDNATMVSEIDGSVVEILYEVGELVPAGYPVIVIKGNSLIVESGVVSDDLNKLNVNEKCYVLSEGNKINSKILTIASAPSADSRVFKVEIVPEDLKDLAIGDIVNVEFIVGKEKAIWIPLSAIMSTEIDYVYTVREDSVDKAKVKIISTKGTMAKIDGLKNGDNVVVEGMKNLRLGDKVRVVK